MTVKPLTPEPVTWHGRPVTDMSKGELIVVIETIAVQVSELQNAAEQMVAEVRLLVS